MQMLRITVDQGSSTDMVENKLRAGGTVRQGDARIRVGAPSNYADRPIFVSTGDAQVRLSGQAESKVERRSVNQFLTVLQGSPAFISVGRSVPFTSQLRYYSRRHPQFVETVEYKSIDTGFQVLPEIQGSMVVLEIKPFMSFLDEENPGQIVFHDMLTTVRLPLGAWYDLADHTASDDGLIREILGLSAVERSNVRHVRIRVDHADN
jgi:hypothetical protein